MSPADAVKAAISDELAVETPDGEFRLVRRRRVGVEIFARNADGKYPRRPALVLDEIEAASINNTLDELLRQ